MVVWAALPSKFKGASLSYDSNSAHILETACYHHAIMMSQEHCCQSTFYRLNALSVTRPTAPVHYRRQVDSDLVFTS